MRRVRDAAMEHALAVVEPDESAKRLVREAGELAGGVNADLTLLHVTTREEYAERRDARDAIPDLDASFTLDDALDGAEQFARDVGREVLAGVAVDWTAAGSLGDAADTVLAEAQHRGCDHVFVAGRKRSPAGKAIFGDVAQQVILEFDGAVTVLAE